MDWGEGFGIDELEVVDAVIGGLDPGACGGEDAGGRGLLGGIEQGAADAWSIGTLIGAEPRVARRES